MTKIEMLQTAKATLDGLPAEQLKVAAEFLRYLDERATVEATEELLKMPGLIEDLEVAEKNFAEGKGVDWREVRQDV